MPDPSPGRPRSRGIYLLPNLFTTAALFSGFYAILAAINGRFEHAAIAIFVAMVLDGLDGRVARMTNTQTAFGVEYDSLSDMMAFGLAPSVVVYVWSLGGLGKLGWLAAFIYTAGAALRLARSFVDNQKQTGAVGNEDAKVLNLMQVGGAQQVLLEVKVAEISRTLVRRMDIDFNIFNLRPFIKNNEIKDNILFFFIRKYIDQSIFTTSLLLLVFVLHPRFNIFIFFLF